MKKRYIQKVLRELHASHEVKDQVREDLDEIFDSALEHGDSEDAIISRIGPPREYADQAADEFGLHNANRRKYRSIFLLILSTVISVAAFIIFGVAETMRPAEHVIGQADALTDIQIPGSFSLLPIILILAILAAVTAICEIVLIIHDKQK